MRTADAQRQSAHHRPGAGGRLSRLGDARPPPARAARLGAQPARRQRRGAGHRRGRRGRGDDRGVPARARSPPGSARSRSARPRTTAAPGSALARPCNRICRPVSCGGVDEGRLPRRRCDNQPYALLPGEAPSLPAASRPLLGAAAMGLADPQHKINYIAAHPVVPSSTRHLPVRQC